MLLLFSVLFVCLLFVLVLFVRYRALEGKNNPITKRQSKQQQQNSSHWIEFHFAIFLKVMLEQQQNMSWLMKFDRLSRSIFVVMQFGTTTKIDWYTTRQIFSSLAIDTLSPLYSFVLLLDPVKRKTRSLHEYYYSMAWISGLVRFPDDRSKGNLRLDTLPIRSCDIRFQPSNTIVPLLL